MTRQTLRLIEQMNGRCVIRGQRPATDYGRGVLEQQLGDLVADELRAWTDLSGFKVTGDPRSTIHTPTRTLWIETHTAIPFAERGR